MKKIKAFLVIVLAVFITCPLIVSADSGLDAKYDSNSITDAISSIASGASSGLKLLVAQPGDKDYQTCHIIIAIICIIVFCVFTNIYLFKLNNKKRKGIVVFGISLIPTVLFSIFSLLTNLQLFLYIVLTSVYVIAFMITTKKITKKRLKRNLEIVKEIDKRFNQEELDKDTFEVYKKIQIAWMNFDLDCIKEIISDKIYSTYQKQLDKMKKDNQKNIMDRVEFKSNKITDIKIENNIETIECEMSVTCIDYIIDDKEKIIKGKKDKINTYTYRLTFNKDLSTNNYMLIGKKILKQK